MKTAERPIYLRYGVAILLVLAAFLLTISTPLKDGAPFLLLIAAVILGTWYGGMGPGLVADLLAFLCGLYFFLDPLLLTGTLSLHDFMRLGAFVLTSLVLSMLAADRDRARELARAQARRQAALAELGQSAVIPKDLQALLDEATSLICHTLEVDNTHVLELLPDGQSLTLRAGCGWKTGYVNSATVPAGSGSQAAFTLSSQTPVVSGDLRSEKRFYPPQLFFDHGIVSSVTVPITGPGHPFGVLGAHTRRRRTFAADEVQFLQSVANVLASAVQYRHAQRALSHTNELLETMFSAVDLSVAYLDPYFNFIRVNRVYAETNGHAPEFFPGKNHFMLYPNAENDAIFRRVLETGEPYTAYAERFELPAHPERGATYWDWTLHPVKDAGGAVSGLVLTLVDVTAHVRAQESQREIEEQLRQVLRHTPLVIGALDRNGVFTVAEGSLFSGFGIEREEVVGKSVWELTQDLLQVRAVVQRAFAGEPSVADFEVQGRILLCDVWPVKDSEGQVTGVKGMALDVTERHRGEQQLRDLAREIILLQEQDRYQIARILNDEIGQVLAASKMSFESVHRDLADEHAMLLQERMGSAISQVGETIAQLRSLAQVLRPAALKTMGLNSTVADYCRKFAATYDMPIDYRGEDIPGLPDVVSISLYRLLQEAFANAVKHARATRIGVTLGQDPTWAELYIQYDGDGFDADAVLPGPRGRRGSGLSTAQERFRLLGGSLLIDSHSGQGTKLVARLPRTEQADAG